MFLSDPNTLQQHFGNARHIVLIEAVLSDCVVIWKHFKCMSSEVQHMLSTSSYLGMCSSQVK